MAWRTLLFDGVMAARARKEDKTQQRNPAPTSQPAAHSTAEREQSQAQVVDLAAFRAMHPGVVEMSQDKQD